ncbi:methylcrotonoyl-CoA carboxylase subunit alpha, mitochondrial [Planococcus citri]|uniref:methylcrotonoyl-CoA carboxylase subunit alpha, mitochondrial n=1 Tax=Planococcus citri TaxID=170843 RepID=UPI0031F83B56
MKKNISKILIANRGEIACRIIRSARKLGIKTVSVYSEVDRNARNVLESDEAYCIGPAPSSQSYLNQNKLISLAKNTNCDAVHPGYGFLSENATFAEFCERNGLVFIGPPASAIRDMGIKSTSKRIMSEAGVPVIPGYHAEDQDNSVLRLEAGKIGFPVMIKAILGGGGKGMRISLREDDFISQLESARRESLSSFGDENVLLEKYIQAPRHVEVQVFADQYGNCVHLNERDCSIQRRHQKVIEEAPAPRIDSILREQIGSAAVRAAKAVNYVGAGTVEFIYDEPTNNFYFMEMNTRLQVEHPITEMITGTDLVEWQIRVASGEELPLKQDQIPLKGHSVEARIYAEDTYSGFLPSAGHLSYLNLPEQSDGVRVETGVRENDEVSVHYDPMIAKLVVWAETRSEAFAKLHSKLLECHIVGLNTNLEFLSKLCSNRNLLDGKIDTSFIDSNKEDLLQRLEPKPEEIVQAALGLILRENELSIEKAAQSGDPYDPFLTLRGFRVNHLFTRDLKMIGNAGKDYNLKITYNKSNSYTIQINGSDEIYHVEGVLEKNPHNRTSLVSHFADMVTKCNIHFEDDFIHIFTQNGTFSFEIWRSKLTEKTTNVNVNDAVSPMPGIVNKILVKVGDKISAGDAVMIVIAMKMELVIKASKDGIVQEVLYDVGGKVPKGVPVIKY